MAPECIEEALILLSHWPWCNFTEGEMENNYFLDKEFVEEIYNRFRCLIIIKLRS